MIDPRTMYDVIVYDYNSLDPELKRYTDKRSHSMYVVKIKAMGDSTEVTTVNSDGRTGKEYFRTFIINTANIFSVRNIKTGNYLLSLAHGSDQE